MHGLVRELALQVYKTICNNIFKLGNLLHSMSFGRSLSVVRVMLLFYVHGKHLWSCRDGQLSYPHFS